MEGALLLETINSGTVIFLLACLPRPEDLRRSTGCAGDPRG